MNEWKQQRFFWLSIMFIVFVIPFVGTLLFYLRIICRIRQTYAELMGLAAQAHHRSLHSVAVMVTIVLTSTIICWAPITVYWIIIYTHEKDPNSSINLARGHKHVFSELRYVGETFIFIHAAIQPAIYFLSGSKLRGQLLRLFPCLAVHKW